MYTETPDNPKSIEIVCPSSFKSVPPPNSKTKPPFGRTTGKGNPVPKRSANGISYPSGSGVTVAPAVNPAEPPEILTLDIS